LLVRKPRSAWDPLDDVVEPGPGQDRHAVPLRLTVQGERVTTALEFGSEQFPERVVGELGLLQADDVGLPLVQPRQQPRDPLVGGVDVPGCYAHRAYSGRAGQPRLPRHRAPRGWILESLPG